jgi:SAM-dependent methyltransferase
MTAEFTGERVVPGQVDIDLWNEHIARYAFAARLSRNRRVLDIGCGTGYGSAELSAAAQSVTGVDVAPEALAFARQGFSRANIRWVQGSAAALPFAAASFDLLVAFEVIEHLSDWPSLLHEARRVMAPGGQLIVSTPNKQFYAETRRDSGPNPFHEHEFEYDEFRDALLEVFASVSIFVEDHTEGVLFRAVQSRGGADVRLDAAQHEPRDSHFFIAVCAMTVQTGAPTFLYIPKASNLLKEKTLHIARLQDEVRKKDAWLAGAQAEHQELLQRHRDQIAELEKSNAWARDLDAKLTAAGKRLVQVQDELESEQKNAQAVAQAYEAKLSQITDELVGRTEAAARQTAELSRAVELLDKAEATVEERTRWALDLQRERDAFELELSKVRASRWVRLGRSLGLGPEIHKI